MKKIIFLICFFSLLNIFGQEIPKTLEDKIRIKGPGNISKDSTNNGEINVKLSGKTKYTDYKIISFRRDTTYIDTTLTIKKEYKFNFLRKDNFELLAFQNQGQTFNNLGYNFKRTSLFPNIGFKAKEFSFLDIEDINYYQVPTPTTEILYRSGLEQGQVLDFLFTTNFSERLNVAFQYKGLRSLGQYRNSLSSHGNFVISYHYQTKEGQYSSKGQFVNQDLTNEESGGLTPTALQSFIDEDPNFTNRGRLDVNLDGAENVLEGKRIYFEQDLKLLSSKDSTSKKDFSNLKLGHSFTRESKFYRFTQSTANTTFFGNANITSNVNDKTTYLLYNNQAYLDFNSKYVLGRFRVKANYTTYKYGYDSIFNKNVNLTKAKLKGDAVSFGADWNAKIKGFHLNASTKITPGNGRLSGSNFYGEAFYKKDSVFTLKGRLSVSSQSPNFNYQFLQSSFDAYNWQNNFNNIDTRNLGGTFESKWGNISLDITNIDNYMYFDVDNKPKQASVNINYLKLKASKEFKFGKFALDNTIMYQNVSSGSSVFRVPEFVTRNTFYYTDEWFKGKPLLVNIGATFKYFTKYKANAYNPLLAEFTLQNTTDIGYPTLDLFFNARVRRTRIYFKADNISSMFLKPNYFSAPGYPYRDFVIRFGVVWNWFI